MTEQHKVPETCSHCETLVIQCEARIGAANGDLNLDGQHGLRVARRVAWIVLENRQRGRIVAGSTPDSPTGVPDYYVDKVLHTFFREGPTVDALRAADEDAWDRLLGLMHRRAFGYLMRSGVEVGQADHLAQDVAQSCGLTLWVGALESYPFDTPFEAWVSRAVEYSVSQWRRSAKEQRQQHALSLDESAGAAANVPVKGTLYDILPDRRDEEIAAEMGRSVQAVYNLRHRALRAMRHDLGSVIVGLP